MSAALVEQTSNETTQLELRTGAKTRKACEAAPLVASHLTWDFDSLISHGISTVQSSAMVQPQARETVDLVTAISGR